MVDGKTYELKTMGAEEVFGEMSLIKQSPRTATVTAVTSVEVLRLDRNSFFLLLGPLADVMKERIEKYERSDRIVPNLQGCVESCTVMHTGTTGAYAPGEGGIQFWSILLCQ